MKKGKIFTNCLSLICTIALIASFASCSADSDSSSYSIDEKTISEAEAQAETPYSLVLKAYSENKDITSKGDVDNTTLFIFDQNNDFYKQITVDRTYLLQAKTIEFNCPNSDKVTVIAWSGISGEEISSMSNANIISDLEVSLKQNNGVVSNLPGDIFYGKVVLNRNNTKSGAANQLKIERKVSSLRLITDGIVKMYDSKEGNYYYKVKNTKASFNYNGETTGSDVEYIIPASVNEKGKLVANSTNVLPSSDITIELYKDDNMILSSKNLKNTEKVAVNEGEQTNVTFDISRNSGNISVSDWGTVIVTVVI